jgi:hypothetical protein
MAHTPGPWTVGTQTGHGAIGILGPSLWGITEKEVCGVYLNRIDTRWKWGEETINRPENLESRSNARLISAAPALLAACEELVAEFDTVSESLPDGYMRFDTAGIELARQAIAAAKGA